MPCASTVSQALPPMWGRRSTTCTRNPASAIRRAAVAPEKPAPTTRTSTRSTGIGARASGAGAQARGGLAQPGDVDVARRACGGPATERLGADEIARVAERPRIALELAPEAFAVLGDRGV